MKYLFNGYQKIRQNKLVVQNFAYMSFLQVFVLLYPLITYPYLTRVLGSEMYGVIITAQVLASYASLFIDFGSNFVCAKHVAINRDDPKQLSKILSNVLALRFIIFCISFVLYAIIVYLVSDYRRYLGLFLLTYGFTTNELFFPQFLYQGLEKMKHISIISVITKLIFLPLIFLLVKGQQDAYMVPLIYSFGFLVGGCISLYIINVKMKIKMVKPSFKEAKVYLKDASPVFATDFICTIKDKFNYFLIGIFVGMSDVVVYDLGVKLYGIAAKPYMIICSVLFPRIAQTRNVRQLKQTILFSFVLTTFIVLIGNIFLSDIVIFFLHKDIDLFPLRIFLLAPVILSISYVLSNNFFVAFGYNKYLFYSILVTTICYLLVLLVCWLMGMLNNIMTFICIAIISFMVELLYRLIISNRLFKLEKK